MKKYFLIFSLSLSLLLIFSFASKALETNPTKILSENEVVLADLLPLDSANLDDAKVDVLDVFLLLNGENAPVPSKDFSTGHIEHNRDEINVKETDYGYLASLPASNQVPSPSVYKGVVYMSGGFGSMEYYALEAKTGNRIWGITLDDDGPSSPAIEDDIMVFNTESCTIFACDVETGDHLWSYWMGDPLMSMPTISNGIVYSAYPAYYDLDYYRSLSIDTTGIYPSHVLIAFDLYSGEILWQQWIDGDVMSAPVAKNEDLYLATFSGTLLQYNQKSGELLSAKAIRATSAPVIESNEEIYISRRSDLKNEAVTESVSVLDIKTVSKSKDFRKSNAPYLDKDVQEQAEYKSESTMMDAGNGFTDGAPSSSGWQKANENIGYSNVSSLQQYQGSRTLKYGDNLYNTMGNKLIVTDVTSGDVAWEIDINGDYEKSGGFMGTPPIQVAGYIILADFEGKVTIVNAKSGDLVKEFATGESIRAQPVVDDGWIYTSTTTGKLVAIDTKMKDLTGWPTWGGNAARTNN